MAIINNYELVKPSEVDEDWVVVPDVKDFKLVPKDPAQAKL